MNDFNFDFIKKDIKGVLFCKSVGKEVVYIYKENREFFEELLEKKFSIIIDDGIIDRIDINEITQEDIITLQKYLDYINMIED